MPYAVSLGLSLKSERMDKNGSNDFFLINNVLLNLLVDYSLEQTASFDLVNWNLSDYFLKQHIKLLLDMFLKVVIII